MDFTIDDARRYIAAVRWQFARTMPQWPHWYTVKVWRPNLVEQHEAFCTLILRDGIVIPWPPPPARPRHHNRYLFIDGYKYWPLGASHPPDRPARVGDPASQDAPLEELGVINRTTVPEPLPYRDLV